MTAIIEHYFRNITESQREQFAALGGLYSDWNSKINVISRRDIDNLYTNHVLHSLAIARFTDFKSGTTVFDIGTGGGFPGIPLAIMFPQANFHLVDRVGKKLHVVDDIVTKIGLKNVTTQHGDALEVKGKFDFIVSRAAMDLDQLLPLARHFVSHRSINSIANGLICLKGGDLNAEIARCRTKVFVEEISSYFSEEYFTTKKVIYVPL